MPPESLSQLDLDAYPQDKTALEPSISEYTEDDIVSLKDLDSDSSSEAGLNDFTDSLTTHHEPITFDLEVDQTVTAIMDILESFSAKQKGNETFVGREVFSPRVRLHVAAGRQIPMVLPAFPAKSINLVDKVLGTMPDLGEELALDRLNHLCTRVQEVYPPGAMVMIATDGACYNGM